MFQGFLWMVRTLAVVKGDDVGAAHVAVPGDHGHFAEAVAGVREVEEAAVFSAPEFAADQEAEEIAVPPSRMTTLSGRSRSHRAKLRTSHSSASGKLAEEGHGAQDVEFLGARQIELAGFEGRLRAAWARSWAKCSPGLVAGVDVPGHGPGHHGIQDRRQLGPREGGFRRIAVDDLVGPCCSWCWPGRAVHR